MARALKSLLAAAVLVAIAIAVVAAVFVAKRAVPDRPPVPSPDLRGINLPTPPPPREAAMPTKQEEPDSGPLACSLAPVEDRRQRSRYEKYPFPPPLIRRAKPRTRRNPLLSGIADVRIVNRSSDAVNILSLDPAQSFSAIILIEDSQGRHVPFPHQGPSSLKRLGRALTGGRTVTLKPGQGVAQECWIWDRLNSQDVPKAGTYFARAVASYYRASDGQDCRIESPRIRITIEEDEIREYLAYCKMIEDAGGMLVDEPN